MKPALTHRQQQALDFIASCLDEHGYPPTLREIGEHMGIKSTNGVNDHLRALERKGYLTREDMKEIARAVERFMQPAERAATEGLVQGRTSGGGRCEGAPVIDGRGPQRMRRWSRS